MYNQYKIVSKVLILVNVYTLDQMKHALDIIEIHK